MGRSLWTGPEASTALTLFVILAAFRYLRLFVGIYAYRTFKAIPVLSNPAYRSYRDVTVVVPTTFKTPDELADCINGILRCTPAAVFVVTSESNVAALKSFCSAHGFDKFVKVLGVQKLNKRKQILTALLEVKTAITVFADDDVFWPVSSGANFLDYLTAAFEDSNVGAAGPRQRVRRTDDPNSWWFLGCSYLERRVWNSITTNAIDGSISTLSGRTSAYRTSILRSAEFFHYFQNDFFLGHPLNSDDDKCLTRFIYSHGWKIALQTDPRAIIETSLETDSKYLSQCLRWARAHWRGNFTVMTNESYWRSLTYCWGCYVIYCGQFQTPSIIVDSLLMGLLAIGLNQPLADSKYALTAMACWIVFTEFIKLIPHFCRHPEDLKFAPVSLVFSGFHGFLNMYSLATLHHTHWGSQNLGEGEGDVDEDIVLPEMSMNSADEQTPLL